MNNTVKFLIIFIVALIIGGLIGYYLSPKKAEVPVIAVSKPTLSTDSIPLDAVPDDDVIAKLNALPNAKPADTAFNRIVLNVGSQPVSLPDFIEFENNTSGLENKMQIQPTAAYQFLSSLRPNNIRVLELFELWRQAASVLVRRDFKFLGEPKQTKIGYSWGSKQYKQRAVPSHERGGICDEKVHGLDCSGFIYQLFTMNSIPMPEKQAYANMERQPTFLLKCLKPFFAEQSFQVTDLGKIAVSEMQTGDIIYFRNQSNEVFHIAIVLVNDQGTVSLFQSLGGPKNCTGNLDKDHGPIVKVLTEGIKNDSKYACVRISADINL